MIWSWLPQKALRVLDLGCGEGVLARAMALKYGQVVAADLNLETFLLAAKDDPSPKSWRVVAAGEVLPFPDEYSDVIVFSEVLEHTFDELRVLQEVIRILQPDGTLILSVPRRGITESVDPENLIGYLPLFAKWLRLPKPNATPDQPYRLASYEFHYHRHYFLAQIVRMLGERFKIERYARKGLVFPFLALPPRLFETLVGHSVGKAFRWLSFLRDPDLRVGWGPLGYNLFVLATKKQRQGQ